ncbi:YhfT family protein [Cellulomonas denverensis]|uniref:Permease n=1 Tax=Cellulomonas denverensis TaxID=264297 RepID=A0A7X6R0A3_9CELL|nr:YhfT family protein [Cellulomonas denverensis]NKY23962.1 permease [Cellulomonas denverensis]GIG24915.1 membrane protein [Cellulomonas denverensis]
MSAVLAASAASGAINFQWWQSVVVMAVCAVGALLAQQALAVFNDGVRPFLLDFIQGRTTRPAMAAIAFGLSAGFIFGLGAPMALSTTVLNPWLIFLPVEILGLLAPRRWIAAIAGIAWGAVCSYGLAGATTLAGELPVDFLSALTAMSDPILWLFCLFPVLAIARQFGKAWGGIAFGAELVVVVFFVKAGEWWGWSIFAPSVAMAVGVVLLLVLAVRTDLRARAAQKAELLELARTSGQAAADEAVRARAESEAVVDELFGPNAARLRRHTPWFMVLGAGVAMVAASGIFGGGEATSFLIAQGDFTGAASMDLVRVLGFVPLIVTTALASGAYAMAGITIVYPVGYLLAGSGLPLGVTLALAAIAGAAIFGVEISAVSFIGKWLGRWPSIRDSSDHIRSGITESLGLAILVGSLMAANALGGGMAMLIVGGLYLVNEAMGRPVVRMAAGPAAVLVAGVLLNLLYWANLFTPVGG